LRGHIIRRSAATALLAFLLWTTTGRAGDIRVILVSPGAREPITSRLLDELVSLGITVEVIPGDEGDLAELARARGASAALRVTPSRDAVDLWIDSGLDAADPASTKLRVEGTEADQSDLAPVLALRTVELLRGRLLKVERAEARRPAPAPSPTSVRTPDRAPPPEPPAAHPPRRTVQGRVSLYLLPSVVVHPASGISASGAALGGVRWMITSRIGGDLSALVSVVPAVIEAPGGEARISGAVIGIGAWVALLDGTLPVATGFGAGLAAGFMNYDGEATASNVRGLDGTVPYALPYARWAFEWSALPPLGLRAEILAGIAAPRPVIRLAGREDDGLFGQPLLAFALGLQMSIP
jgi:hypothetical protein